MPLPSHGEGYATLDTSTKVIYSCMVVVLVLGAGCMSGLTLGLLSLDVMDLKVLQASGTTRERGAAGRLIPLVERPHWLLCTLLLCNAACMEVRSRDLPPAPVGSRNGGPAALRWPCARTARHAGGSRQPHAACCCMPARCGARRHAWRAAPWRPPPRPMRAAGPAAVP